MRYDLFDKKIAENSSFLARRAQEMLELTTGCQSRQLGKLKTRDPSLKFAMNHLRGLLIEVGSHTLEERLSFLQGKAQIRRAKSVDPVLNHPALAEPSWIFARQDDKPQGLR